MQIILIEINGQGTGPIAHQEIDAVWLSPGQMGEQDFVGHHRLDLPDPVRLQVIGTDAGANPNASGCSHGGLSQTGCGHVPTARFSALWRASAF
ncbi:MAG: hypothetical protein A2Y76_11870 [Planctomycetes bacterium RBG_13_60_9]|nr:MAG: hypothetical protein A2Y76_11870 [Planctomycetes bacterium RBG_13_60_9]